VSSPRRFPVKLPARRAVVVLATSLLAAVPLAACGGSKTPSSASGSSSGSSSTASTSVGVKVAGKFGEKPTLTVPNTPAPTKLTTDVLTQGSGPAVTAGQSLIVNYLGQTWAPKDGKPNVFDNSFDKHQPFAFPLGKKAVIPGWDQALVGQKAGSRLLLTIPPDLAYGTTKDANQPLAGQTLLFVVDVLGGYDVNSTATGSATGGVPSGFPQVKSASGQVPTVTSVKGVKLGKTPQSALLIQGTGPVIDATKTLVVQLLQVDAKTGKPMQSTWSGAGPQPLSGTAALQAVTAFKGAHVGSRAVVLSPAPTSSDQQGVVVVVDVLSEF
jgi:peptidylprolyl isomerase